MDPRDHKVKQDSLDPKVKPERLAQQDHKVKQDLQDHREKKVK